jgi:hypothetical protein
MSAYVRSALLSTVVGDHARAESVAVTGLLSTARRATPLHTRPHAWSLRLGHQLQPARYAAKRCARNAHPGALPLPVRQNTPGHKILRRILINP